MPKYISDHTSHTALLFNWIIEHFLLHMQIFLWLLHEHTVQEWTSMSSLVRVIGQIGFIG